MSAFVGSTPEKFGMKPVVIRRVPPAWAAPARERVVTYAELPVLTSPRTDAPVAIRRDALFAAGSITVTVPSNSFETHGLLPTIAIDCGPSPTAITACTRRFSG